MPKEYKYVGSAAIYAALPTNSGRILVGSGRDVLRWIQHTHQPNETDGSVIATFIVDTLGKLWINDRQSEHVLCAAGQNVLSAGEMTFEISRKTVEVMGVTNQSTGYCPEPESFDAVDSSLKAAGIDHPVTFTTEFLFRRCGNCHALNIIKDEWFFCDVCDAPLSQYWNVEPITAV